MRIKERLAGVVSRIGAVLKNRVGAQTIEWVALGLMVMTILAVASAYISGLGEKEGGDTIGQTIVDKIENILEKVGQEEKK